MKESNKLSLPLIILVTALLGTLGVYWTGLQGPFLLDDDANLSAIPQWLEGKLALASLIFERGAGTFGRPVSMATFALNGWIGGYTPASMKTGNLIIHLLIGIAVFILLQKLLRRDTLLAGHASLAAAAIATLWLLHPLHASTVLYVVQRMAQLSSLIILSGLAVYVHIRIRAEESGSTWLTDALIIGGVPLLTALAFLAKENGALLPLLCGVVELAYFASPRPRIVRWFYSLFLLIPSIAAVLFFTLNPARLTNGFTWRDFTLTERLLTQGRVLIDYIFKLIVPNPPQMGVYMDDFTISHGLLSPPSTLLSILALLAVSYAAWHWRKSMPSVFFGWFFFLAAHSLEAGPIPLELYFEHRNYLPSIGLIVASAGLVAAIGQPLRAAGMRTGRIGSVLTLGFATVLAFGAHGRAIVWRDSLTLAESSLAAHPDSLRASGAVIAQAMSRQDIPRVDAVIAGLLASPQPRNRSMGHAFRLYVDCLHNNSGDPADLEAFVTQTPMPLTLNEAQPFFFLYAFTEKNKCGAVTDQMIGKGLARLIDRESKEHQPSLYRLRYQSANYLIRAGDWLNAAREADLAWTPSSPSVLAVPLIYVRLEQGDFIHARRILSEAKRRSNTSNTSEQLELLLVRKTIDRLEKQ